MHNEGVTCSQHSIRMSDQIGENDSGADEHYARCAHPSTDDMLLERHDLLGQCLSQPQLIPDAPNFRVAPNHLSSVAKSDKVKIRRAFTPLELEVRACSACRAWRDALPAACFQQPLQKLDSITTTKIKQRCRRHPHGIAAPRHLGSTGFVGGLTAICSVRSVRLCTPPRRQRGQRCGLGTSSG